MSAIKQFLNPNSNYVPVGIRNFARVISYFWVLFACLSPYGVALFAWGPSLLGSERFFEVWFNFLSYLSLPFGVWLFYSIGKKKQQPPTWLEKITHKYPWRVFWGGVALYAVGLIGVLFSDQTNFFDIGFGLVTIFFLPFDAIILFFGLMVVRQVDAKLDMLDKTGGRISNSESTQ